MRSGEKYQIALIVLGAIVAIMYAVFLYREVFPEYRLYQQTYVDLEKFRSSYTKEPPPPFEPGIKQIVIEREDKGPPVIDRCISCHVALQFSHFSPTKIAKDSDGKTILNDKGIPVQIPNEDYIWKKLDDEVDRLTNVDEIAKLRSEGKNAEADTRIKKANELSSLKRVRVDDHIYDVPKVLAMHPLIGKETRPFEFHPIEEYGCTTCHNGNGRGLTTEKAHGPVLDEQYKVEFMGPKPQFLEIDPDNDPPFSHMFNDKPGHELLFQTTPLFIGSLTQAKCMQCHTTSKEPLQGSLSAPLDEKQPVNTVSTDIDALTSKYQQGRDLYISQACYACHRITGFARGGVGPELTKIGNNYPWYIKESIVWPQADLRTSTMPNYVLDHEELEALMTYLLAQKGDSKVVSETARKISNQEWEAGKKSSWKKPISPVLMQDLRYGMTVFATEGCAACHRLKGYESNIGFAVEKEGSFEELYKERQWFSQLFPEDVRGTEIVAAIEQNKDEIDRRIVENVRQNAILEEIEEKFPGEIEALYSPFKFASRAKNKEFADKMMKASSEQMDEIKKEQEEWKARINKIRMMFIQEYGLGRLICPRPNWSGIYRSDEWLIEHFHNPSSHVPRSIMPVFPFDDTKFYALTNMLDKLAIRNRDEVREIWKNNGFNPEQAFQIHCSQCHGVDRTGDGPVATWIYPIPKNLRNADFLRNLTKEQAINSITHGVHGTPMPPWGEVAKDKPDADGIPVLTHQEIVKLVNWLFSFLPGGQIIRESTDVPKWNYTPADVLKELKNEGNTLPEQVIEQPKDPLSAIPRAHHEKLIALSDPLLVTKTPPDIDVEDVFESIPNEELGRPAYFIKKKFYTEDNLAAGKKFFEINCAVCHGKEADGSGIRAGFMQESKPRMLTNLDWINTRDDLRLIQSIKFGVPGTAMTPWGDLTSSLQRLQLVMYIRSLTQERQKREELTNALYQVFNTALVKIDRARVKEYAKLMDVESEYKELKNQRETFEEQSKAEEAAKVYPKELEVVARLNQLRNKDAMYIHLKKLVETELSLYQNLGLNIVAAEDTESIFKEYLKLVLLNQNRFAEDENGHLKFMEKDEKISSGIVQKIIQAMDNKIADLERKKRIVEGKITSKERTDELTQVQADIRTFTSMKNKMITDFNEAQRLQQQEQQTANKIMKSEL